jgi:aspartyl-tRNA(Asn)/glutamyl-tRNA(Gln) amidotransferase subunit A
MDEFAMGSSTENSAFFPTRNPWDTQRIPGGSSGGSAAAVAAGGVCMALGSDTGGSIRQPAAMTGIVGFKPTYGMVSRFGLVAFASSLDQIGPMTKNVEDAAILMDIISGKDPLDSTSLEAHQTNFYKNLKSDTENFSVGLPREYIAEGVDKEVEDAIKDAINIFKKLGARIKEVSLPMSRYGIATYYIVASSEASSNLARYDGVHFGFRKDAEDHITMVTKTRSDGFGKEVKRRIMLGTYALSSGYYEAYYLRAQKFRRLIKEDYERVFKEVDVIAGPTSPFAAFNLGEKLQDPLQMYLCDIFTVNANLAGIPAISIPCGFTKKGLPIGLHLQAKAFEDLKLLQIAYRFENALSLEKFCQPKMTL